MAKKEKTLPAEFAGKELVITRLFESPKEWVFKAWTEPEKIKKWWGPKGFTAPVVKVDLRPGGKYLYAMQDSSGKKYWSGGVFKKVDAPNRIVVVDHFADEKGNEVSAAAYGMNSSFPQENIINFTFTEEGDGTRVKIISQLPESLAAREALWKSHVVESWKSSLDKLEKVLIDN